jgi:hypothetical protein
VGLAEEVIDAVDLPEIIRESTGSMASDTVRGARMQGIHADEAVGRAMDRILLRRSRRDPGGPQLEQRQQDPQVEPDAPQVEQQARQVEPDAPGAEQQAAQVEPERLSEPPPPSRPPHDGPPTASAPPDDGAV